MKFKYILFTWTLWAATSFPALSQSNSLSQKFQPQIEAWKIAYNSGDARNLKALYTEDATYISSHVPDLEAAGRDNVLAYFQKGISGGGHIDDIKILSGESAGGITYLLTRYQATNSGQTVTGRNLLVLKKVKKKWLIVVHMTVV